MIIEKHYKKPMDIEWGRDGGWKIYILQRDLRRCIAKGDNVPQYILKRKTKILITGEVLDKGLAREKLKLLTIRKHQIMRDVLIAHD